MRWPYSRFGTVGDLQSYDPMGTVLIGLEEHFYPEMRTAQEQKHQPLR